MRTAVSLALLLFLISASYAAVPNGGRDAVWSGDGKQLAFVSGLPHGISNVWVMNTDGSKPVQLTHKGGHSPQWVPGTQTICFSTSRSGREQLMSIGTSSQPGTEKAYDVLPTGAVGPKWSADGKKVAFLMPSQSGRSRDLWTADANGSNGKGISMNFYVRDYAWSPDGKHIAFIVGRAIGSSLWIADVDTKDVDVFYKGFCSAPAYSPDGKHIALAAPANKGAHKIVYIDVATGVDKRIMAESFDGSTIRWKPNGQGFLFTSNHNNDIGIWSVDSEGRSRQRITDKKLAAYSPVYSPDGKKIAFFATASDSYGPDVYTADTNGSNVKRLTVTAYSNWAPVWSHNGAKLAVVSDAEGAYKLLVVDPKSGKVNNPALIKPLTPFKLAWSPNDAKILAVQGQAITVTASTAAKPSEKQIVRVNKETDACWSLDSKSVFFTDWNQNCAGISLTDQVEKKPQQITTGSVQASKTEKIKDQNVNAHSSMGIAGPVEEITSETISISDLYPRLSPNGKLVAFIRNDQVWTVDVSGREQRQITNLAAPKDSEAKSDISSLEWSPNGKGLVFQRHLLNEQSGLEFQIWTVELESGEAEKVYAETVDTEYGVFTIGNTYPPTFTQDGKSLLFTSVIDGGSAICTVDLSGQNHKVLVKGLAVFPSMSSNGTQLAYISLEDCRQRLKLLDLVTGVTKDIKLSR